MVSGFHNFQSFHPTRQLWMRKGACHKNTLCARVKQRHLPLCEQVFKKNADFESEVVATLGLKSNSWVFNDQAAKDAMQVVVPQWPWELDFLLKLNTVLRKLY